MTSVEELEKKLALAKSLEQARQDRENHQQIMNAVNAYKTIQYRQKDLDEAEDKLRVQIQMLTEKQYIEYATLTTEIDKKSNEAELRKMVKPSPV